MAAQFEWTVDCQTTSVGLGEGGGEGGGGDGGGGEGGGGDGGGGEGDGHVAMPHVSQVTAGSVVKHHGPPVTPFGLRQ